MIAFAHKILFSACMSLFVHSMQLNLGCGILISEQ